MNLKNSDAIKTRFEVMKKPNPRQEFEAQQVLNRSAEIILRAENEYSKALDIIDTLNDTKVGETETCGVVGESGFYKTITYTTDANGQKIIKKIRIDNQKGTNDIFEYDCFDAHIDSLRVKIDSQPSDLGLNLYEAGEEFDIRLNNGFSRLVSYKENVIGYDSGKLHSAGKILRFNQKSQMVSCGEGYYYGDYSSLYGFSNAISDYLS